MSLQAWPRCALALLLLRLVVAGAEILQGELPRTSDYGVFIGKFVYDYSEDPQRLIGSINVTVTRENSDGAAVPKQGRMYFMIFDDEHKHWKHARRRWDVSTCSEKMEDISLKTPIAFTRTETKVEFPIRIREHLRPRLWYFTFVACGVEEGLDLSYKVHALNTLQGWQQEFSYDHVGMYTTFSISAAAFALATLALAYVSRWREGTENLREHPYTQLLLLAYVASSVSCTLFVAHYELFMHDGFGSKRLRFLACLGSIVANCTIYLIAILASVGWAISRGPLPHRHLFLGLVTLLGAVHAVCELRAEITIDQSSQLYAYSTPEGTVNVMLKIFMFCWFAYHCKMSYDLEQGEKERRFYKYLGISISGWAINVPVTVILAHALAPYFRYKVVETVDIVARFLGQAVLAQLFCGPLSPISAANTFRCRESDYIDLDADCHGFNHPSGNHDNL